MAVVDVSTGRIVGTKKYSPVWWHEKGHIAFSKTEKGVSYPYYHYSFLWIIVMGLVVNTLFPTIFLKIYLLILALASIYFYAYEEIWAWRYSFKNKHRWRKR